MAGVHTPIAGSPVCGDGTLCGTWAVYGLADPSLRLRGKPYSPTVSGGDLALFTSKPKLRLGGRTYAVVITQVVTFASSAKLRLQGDAYVAYKNVGPTFATGAKLRLRGKTYLLGMGQTIPMGKGRLILRGRPLTKVGQVTLIPTTPEAVILTPSPAVPSAALIPSVPIDGEGLLTPSPARVA